MENYKKLLKKRRIKIVKKKLGKYAKPTAVTVKYNTDYGTKKFADTFIPYK